MAGRPRTILTRQKKDLLLDAASSGAGLDTLAALVKISRPTLVKYLDRNEEFRQALHQGHAMAVVVALKEIQLGHRNKLDWLRRCARSLDYRDVDKLVEVDNPPDEVAQALARYLQQNERVADDAAATEAGGRIAMGMRSPTGTSPGESTRTWVSGRWRISSVTR